MTYLRTRVAASFGTLCAGALVLVACTGKLSLGGNTGSAQAQEVAPSQVSGPVPGCNAGSAHPNVCCAAGPSQAGSCVVYPGAPFTQCDPGTTTYPDPRSCCPLDGSGNCASPPPSAEDGGSGSGGSSGGGCAYACPPGSYAPPNSSGECCQTDSSGATACSGGGTFGSGGAGSSGSSGGISNGGTACGSSCTCPACPPGGGPCPPCNCPPVMACPDPTCGSCPPGWQAPQGSFDLCCMTDASGVIECFSQAGPPGPPPTPVDAGPGPGSGGTCSGSASTDGAVGPCGCQETASNGHTYAVNCDPGTNLCTCVADNGAPSSSFADNGNTCSDPAGLFTSCGFPAQ